MSKGEKKAKAEEAVELVPMTKGGEVIYVHPDNVAAHEALGWTEA